ncbi:peptide-methionine (S)-S-oxide reductase MsrA [Pelagimonas sp. KU-00592-HH]
MEQVAFGGGCHWCTEAVFHAIRGVSEVDQGFAASLAPDDAFSEAVRVTFNPAEVALENLVRVHLATHASTAKHSMRGKYRSAIYCLSLSQAQQTNRIVKEITQETGTEFVTRVLHLAGFRHSDERFREYYKTDPERPFCRTYIDPKLALLRRNLPELLKDRVTT